jgi:hypothetical protein
MSENQKAAEFGLSLSDFASAAPLQGEVTLRGRKVVVRPPSLRVQNVIARAHLEPQVPVERNPNKGSLAPLEPNDTSPDYVAALKVWRREQNTLLAAAALGWKPFPLSVGQPVQTIEEAIKSGHVPAWIEGTLLEVQKDFTDTELGMVWDEVKRIEDAAATVTPGN